MSEKNYIYGGKEYREEEIKELLRPGETKIKGRGLRTNAALSLVEGQKVLDAGCGSGRLAYVLAAEGKDVIGIDMLPQHVEIAKKMYKLPNLSFEVMNANNLKFPENYFDCALFLETIEHIENPAEVLRSLHRVIKPGGCIIVSTPNSVSYSSVLRQMFFKEKKVRKISEEEMGKGTEEDHVCSWDIVTLCRLLQRCGFKYENHRFAGVYGMGPFRRLKLGFLSPVFGRFCEIMIVKARKQ